jgi:hypothetical protein
MKTIKHVAIGLAVVAMIVAGASGFIAWRDAGAGVEDPITPGPYPRQDGFEEKLLDGVTGTTSSGDTLAMDGLPILDCHLDTITGTATAQIQYQMFTDARWHVLKDVSLSAGSTQSYEAWNPLLVSNIQWIVSACSSCDVTVECAAQSYK